MITLFIVGFLILSALHVLGDSLDDKKRATKAARIQERIIEARKGYRHPGH